MGGDADGRITDSLYERLCVTDTNAAASWFCEFSGQLCFSGCGVGSDCLRGFGRGGSSDIFAFDTDNIVTHPSPRLGSALSM